MLRSERTELKEDSLGRKRRVQERSAQATRRRKGTASNSLPSRYRILSSEPWDHLEIQQRFRLRDSGWRAEEVGEDERGKGEVERGDGEEVSRMTNREDVRCNEDSKVHSRSESRVLNAEETTKSGKGRGEVSTRN